MSLENQKRQSDPKMMEESDLSLEVVILIIFGLFMLLFGLLLFKIDTGDLPYNRDSTYGLFLIMVSFQVITLGKTPFGELRRSWALVLAGTGTAVLGMAACFIPGLYSEFIRMLVGVILSAGGLSLFAQLFLSEKKAATWMKVSGRLQQLTIACGLVYVLTFFSGLITLFPGITTNPQTAVLLLIYGVSFFYLSWCIRKVARSYPVPREKEPASDVPDSTAGGSMNRFRLFRDASLPLSTAIMILLGILLTFLGLLLFPVGLGLLPFSPDGQYGLMLTIMAIQMMALGQTPLGQFTRSWLMVLVGLVFAALGVVSSIVPGLLTGMIQILLGALNIMSGAAFFIKLFLMLRAEAGRLPRAHDSVPPILKKLMVIQMVMNIVAIAFGVSMLLPGIVPIPAIAGVLILNGVLLLLLVSCLQQAAKMQSGGEQAFAPAS